MKRYQAVLMDMFDTLVNFHWDRLPLIELDGQDVRTTSPLLFEFLQPGFPGVSREDFCRAFVGASRTVQQLRNRHHREITARERFQRFFEQLGIPTGPDADRLLEAGIAEHMRLLASAMEFPDAHRVVLERLHARFRLAVVSNFDYAPTVKAALRAEGILDRFEAVVVSADVGWCKPRPEIFAEALRRMGVSAAEAIFVGDTPEADVLGAQGMGLDVIWIDRGTAPLPPEAPAPTHTVPSFAGVADLF
jgi:HAD superfamily hydrolase (TIGR01509 family)